MLIPGHEISVANGTQAIYNGFDNCLTFEIDEARQSLAANDSLMYDFERGMQAPALEMTLRGFRVDINEREKSIFKSRKRRESVNKLISEITSAICPDTYTAKLPGSRVQLLDLFYEKMKLHPIQRWINGEMKRQMNRETLEKLETQSIWASPLINAILFSRDMSKTLQVLETEIINHSRPGEAMNWRWHCSYNIGGTATGRWSSSKSPFEVYSTDTNVWKQSGNNFQNVTEELRRIFIPDEGMKLYGIDKAQSEARDVGWFCGLVFGDWSYLDACESGDLHTYVTRLLYPNWTWTGDIRKDRAIANRKFHRFDSYRQASKKLGHACVTSDHEVLTPNGWVPITDKPPVIMQFGRFGSKFVEVEKWTDDPEWTGNFHTWEGQSISITMNETHNVLYTTTDIKGLQFDKVPNIPYSAKIPLGFAYIGGDNQKVTPQIARLIAAYQCDGNWQPGSKQIRFHMIKERKFQRLSKLANLANIETGRTDEERAWIRIEDINDWPKRAGAYLLTWSREALKAYLDELPHWDGHFAPTYTILSSTNYEHLEWIQTCNRIIGYGGRIAKKPLSGFGSQTYTLQINNREYAVLKSVSKKSMEYKTSRVLCPTVASKAFYVRRNGKISVTGNTNYYGKAREIARQTRIPQNLVQEFQDRYFTAFPCIRMMHNWVPAFLQKNRFLVNSFGRRRDFFDHPKSEETIKSAIAYLFQSATGDCLNLGLYRLWKNMGRRIQILSQLHDAVYFQAPIPRNDDEEQALLHEAISHIEVEQHDPKSGRRMTIPGEAVGGFNWAHRFRLLEDGTPDDWNPNGLSEIRMH